MGDYEWANDNAAATASASPGGDAADKTNLVAARLKQIYKKAVLPVEKRFRYDYFYESPFLTDIEFDSKPQLLLVGQYSVGKTSFIRYLLGRDFPGQRVGPEPTTDRFTVLINGPEERTIPGNALSVHPELPFRGLERFGVSFLSRFEGSQLPSTVLKSVTLVDTPGILSGEKQRLNRGYDFTKVVAWFAERADLIILLFDAHKLDISDELKATIDVLKGHEDKIRCILNKADQIDRQQLMRVYGALLWSLGKTMSSPEVARVYVGSFWSEPLQNMDNADLFEREEKDLMKDLAVLPRQSAVRKINELVKRVRKVKTLAYVVGYLKSQMPTMMGKEKKQQKLINDLPNVFRTIMKKYNLAPGDFPDITKFSNKLKDTKFSEFHSMKQDHIDQLEKCLTNDIPRLMEQLPSEKDTPASLKAKMDTTSGPSVPVPTRANKFGKGHNEYDANPFGYEEEDEDNYWALQDSAERLYDSFIALGPEAGFLSPAIARDVLVKTGLDKSQLRQIWNLSDIDRDGHFDHDEYVVAMFLCDAVIQKGRPIPKELPPSVVPPSKRDLIKEREVGGMAP
uniref:Calmodulin n=1 Tax=Helicotheca tamesis TaxID=374047 RepID=A0A7S2N1J3_9STRA|mmetsp:Transcript_7911/g.10889  ORF Transcript_7911/g.10889 Transcript_7911/m.10889 type:complete len:568 (+) Transcript_7911:135-1838(+)|eukprot:CAMPEP_0185724932 /NCGR_PEP_ID=MMETSP1171-20130828/1280_1 /TAXON_ID=374046 /ORGANISM="Helicotheca tamensis, Strain CCMP826" /LENGTH=567 /DNA_ID=CAMNT_0028392907 /DNA_START=54 /DNA_END=1757 /DNA_ORIENTATION=-